MTQSYAQAWDQIEEWMFLRLGELKREGDSFFYSWQNGAITVRPEFAPSHTLGIAAGFKITLRQTGERLVSNHDPGVREWQTYPDTIHFVPPLVGYTEVHLSKPECMCNPVLKQHVDGMQYWFHRTGGDKILTWTCTSWEEAETLLDFIVTTPGWSRSDGKTY